MKFLKTSLAMGLFLSVSDVTAQDQKMSEKLPSIKELPKTGESKSFYELPGTQEFFIYNQLGSEIMSGKAEFVEITHLKKGIYFIKYLDKTRKFEVK